VATEQLFVSIVIILVAARVLGELFQRIKQPPLVGELLAGIIIGPSLLGFVLPSTDLHVLSNLAVFFLMLLAGLEMDPHQIRKVGKPAIVISLVAFFFPLLAGANVALYLFGLTGVQSLFMGLLLSITAVPVTAIVLMQFGILNSKLGNTVMAAAVVNDILSLIVLSIVLQIHTTEGTGGEISFENVAWSGAKIAAFLAGIFIFDILFRKSAGWLPNRVEPFFKKYLRTKEAAFGILLTTTIAISLIAQDVGLHFIIGTFFSGLVVYREMIGRQNFIRVRGIISAITFGFFAPIFFALIGVEFHAQSLVSAIPLFLVLLGTAIVTKILAGYTGAKIARFSNETSLAIGFLMNGRGMVELVIASIGFTAGILDLTLFSVAVGIGFITTLLAPITSKPFVGIAKSKGSQDVTVIIEDEKQGAALEER
jgi:Kef-type K+ transport system membrane component KefB